MAEMSGWGNFYLIVGGAAGALIGLQFVVITLIAERPIVAGQALAGSVFATPTIVHFGAVLLLSAIVSAPWHGVTGIAIPWGLLGLAGMLYEVIVVRRMRMQSVYKPQFEDWLFHVLLPLVAYAALAGSAFATRSSMRAAMYGAGAAALLLLFVGIHNAWDAVTYHIFSSRHGQHEG
jgi:hypothetical protein